MQKLLRILVFTTFFVSLTLLGTSFSSSKDACPSVSDAAKHALFELESVSKNMWKVIGPRGPFYVEEQRELCLFTLSANMSSFFGSLDEAGDVWANFNVRYGTFYSRNGEVHLEQVVVLPYGSSRTLAETLKFFDAIAKLVVQEVLSEKPQTEGNST